MPVSAAAVAAAALLAGGAALRAGLPDWIQHLDASSPIRAALMKVVSMPSGAVTVRRPPRESRAALTDLIGRNPADAELVAMRARAAEEQLDFAAAEQDWQRYAQAASNRTTGLIALADFHHRRLRPADEVKALSQAAEQPFPPRESILPSAEQTPWRTFQRIHEVIEEQAQPATATIANYKAWLARYPREKDLYSRFLDYLIAHKQVAATQELLASYTRVFPDDRVFPVRARAAIEQSQGSAERALAVYDQSFDPLWPPELVQSYFALLQQTHRLREYLSQARAALAANAADLRAAARIFYYYQQQGNLPAAQRPLLEFAQRREGSGATWTEAELWTLGQLFEGVQNSPEAARFYYALYSLPGASNSSVEKSLAAFYNLLMNAPERPVAFGSGDLSLYKDIATMDPHPGFLNGILSLILNTTSPESQFAEQERAAIPYFHRAGAARLLALFDQRFANATARPAMHARLVEAYATYGENEAVIAAGRRFLAAFPNAAERMQVAMLMADAFARKNAVNEEFATYEALLKELAARAGGVPLGPGPRPGTAPPQASAAVEPEAEPDVEDGPRAVPAAQMRRARGAATGPGARSPDYARVLDRYIARLVSKRRTMDALALYRREIDRNPSDPGLYERLAAFLEQNQIAAEVEQVHRKAIQQFPERSWYHKLARWYLRRRQTAAFAQLTGEVVKIFSGSELENYFAEVVNGGGVDARLYRQVNEFAHQRFPSDLVFVRNLMRAYTTVATSNPPAYLNLLRNYWFWDDDIRARYFQSLRSAGRLDAELDAVRAAQPAAQAGRWKDVAAANPAAVRFVAEAEAWRSHFESASAPLAALVAEFPAEADTGRRAASLERSLSAFDPGHRTSAIAIQESLGRAQPRDSQPLTAIGEMYADAEQYRRARPYWDRIPQIRPGVPDGYLEAATIFWDYFQFDDSLRLIGEARRRFAKPTVYAYEAGAVYENKRSYPRAVEEYAKGALAGGAESSARSRLLVLARRPATRALVDKATQLAASRPATAEQVDMRVKVLEAQNRRADLQAFLLDVAQASASPEVLTEIGNTAERLGMEPVRERAYQRQAAVTTDPIERIRLRFALVRYYEGRGDMAAARREMEAVYKDNPRSLGVVRAAVDFYWRNKLFEPAVDTLLAAAAAAYPQLKSQLTFEAARKDTEAGRYQQARQLLDTLRNQDSFNAEYLAAVADTFAREGNDTALRDFYTATIRAVSQSNVEPAERTARVASLRRGLIPALTRLQDYAGAVDQYIEIINRYPEDEAVVREAASYAAAHKLDAKLVTYYTQTATRSPRDYRWPMVLARLHTSLEKFPEAIASYSAATKIRPDRVDLHTARATLETRLLRFDEAAADYTNIYELAYRDPQWMIKVAEVRARQGKTADAVRALEKAFIEGRPDRPGQFFEVARRLESWDMLAPAKQFAERGIQAIPAGRLGDSEFASGVQVYARVMTRLREHETAFALLRQAASSGDSGEGGSYSLRAALAEIGAGARTYFTPEEKAAFVRFLEKQRAGAALEEIRTVLMPVAERAGLVELQANWLYQGIMAQPGVGPAAGDEQRLIELQSQRLRFRELGRQLEAYWKAYPVNPGKPAVFEHVVAAYRAAGDSADELRLLAAEDARQPLGGELQRRYFELLLATTPQQLAVLAGNAPVPGARFAAVSFAIANGGSALALRAVENAGAHQTPVWMRAYTALAGLYYADANPRVNAAFGEALGSMKIGDRLATRLDRNQQLAGDTWFYYGSRYGEYAGVTKRPNGEDFLPAEIEGHPARSSAYFTLAEYYRERGDQRRALSDYQHALELSPMRGDAHDRMALILWQQGKKTEAIAQWKAALEAFGKQQDSGRVPETYWEDLPATLRNIGHQKVLDQVRAEAERVLRTYIRRNGAYRVQPLLEAAVQAGGNPDAGVKWLLELSRSAADPANFLAQLVDEEWLPEAQKGLVFERLVADAETRAAAQYGQAREAMLGELRQWQFRRLDYLLLSGQTAAARAAFDALPNEARQTSAYALAPLEIRLAAQEGKLDALLDRYRREPEKMPEPEEIRSTAGFLQGHGNPEASRKLLEFFYTRQLEQQNLDPSNFLGLAEIRLAEGETAAALGLLHRMTLVAGEPFETQVPAAELLEKAGRHAEAAQFLAERVQASPWDSAARVRLAREELAAGKEQAAPVAALVAVAGALEAAYQTRADAAELLAQHPSGPPAGLASVRLGSGELDLLARMFAPSVTASGQTATVRADAAAQQPFFYRARVKAATTSEPAARVQLLLGAIAIDPDAPAGVRVSLEHAAVQAGRYSVATGAVRPLLEHGGLLYLLRRMESSEEEGEPRQDVRRLTRIGARFLAGIGLTDAERAEAARDLATAFEKLGELEAAEVLLRAAHELQPAGPDRDALRPPLARLEAQVGRRAANAARRPVISENLEQPRIVRPRLTGGAR